MRFIAASSLIRSAGAQGEDLILTFQYLLIYSFPIDGLLPVGRSEQTVTLSNHEPMLTDIFTET